MRHIKYEPYPGDIKGLSQREAKKKFLEFGPNVVYKKEKLRPLVVFLEKFKSPLLVVLIVASVISFFLGESISAATIIFMVLLSAVLDFVNTYKSEKAAKLLNSKVITKAAVIRDNKEEEINLKNIVPGDIVLLSAGNIVPADCELISAKDFFIDQSSLTGESFPIEKRPRDLSVEEKEKNNSLLNTEHLLFMGTTVLTGYATAVVRLTGTRTEFGKVALRLSQEAPETEFEKGVKRFSFFMMRVTLVLVSVVFLINALSKDVFDSFLFAIAVAVGLTPELLPVIMTIAMSHGSLKMSKKDVIVKNLSAIPSFGSMNILCTDKTGTLTENKIVLVKYLDVFGEKADSVLFYAYLNSIFHTSIKSPLDDAIQSFKELAVSGYYKIDEVPFDFSRRRDSIVVEKEGVRTMITKGAPEDVLRSAKFYLKNNRKNIISQKIKEDIQNQFNFLSNDGFRVLGVAIKKINQNNKKVYEEKDERDMVFLGFVAFLDPPKKTVTGTLRELERLGLEIKILTGDSEILTEKICKEINLSIKGVITGKEVKNMSDGELEHRVLRTTIFARVSPDDKVRIILALKKIGKAVGYLGDGINDAPALRAADIGISVNNAVDVAKESADIILLQKSLHVLKDGVIEGRKTFQNTIKYILMNFSSNFGNMISMTGISFFIPFLPMLPQQILLNNFIYDTSQVTLPTDSVDESDIDRPVFWDLKFIKRFMLVFGSISSVFDFLTFAVLIWIFKFSGSHFQTGWFIVSLATQVFVIYIIRTRKIPFLKSSPSKPLFITTLVAVVIGWIIPYTSLARVFGFSQLPISVLIASFAIMIAYLAVVEIAKRRFYRKF
ncbi:MAG: magnesium-translocating P-type ATPase [Patescibacteria group bacterium]|nr:magnesium-translocating P-type ATPase [Patescibacteria group bacterium]